MIDWHLVAQIAVPIATLFVGAWVNRRFERRPNLISYYGHVAALSHTPQHGQPINVHTHSIVIRNAGRRSATNVRIGHNFLPDFNIWPPIAHTVQDVPGGGREIVIPNLVPGEQLTISYLYFPPLTVNQINAGIRSDEGFAHQIPVLLQRQYPRWWNWSVGVLTLTGSVTVAYLLFLAVRALVP